MRLSPRLSSAWAAQAQTAPAAPVVAASASQSAQLQPVSATLSTTAKTGEIPPLQPSPQILGASTTELYTAKRGESIPAVAHQYLKRTGYLTSSELADAIRSVNGNRSGNILKAGEQITVPGILPAPIVEKTVPVPKDFEVRAIYLTGIMAASDHGLRIHPPLARSRRQRRGLRH
jgi:hypothetical protein